VCVCVCLFNRPAPLRYNDSPCTLPATFDNNNSLAPFNSVHIIRAYRIILGQTYVAGRICVLIIYRFPTDRHHSRPSTAHLRQNHLAAAPGDGRHCRILCVLYRYGNIILLLYIIILYIYRVARSMDNLICTRHGQKHTNHYPFTTLIWVNMGTSNIILLYTDVATEPEWVGTCDLCTLSLRNDICIYIMIQLYSR